MAAGQGFKTFTTGEVLTASDVNGYLMQGINVFASSAARASAITSPQEGQYSYLKDTNALEYYDGAAWVGAPVGDITAVTAGTGLSGGGSSGDVTLTNTMATAIDAKGDLVAGTGSDAFSRLAVGANDTVLTADSTTATGLKWATPAAGGMTLISTTTFSGSSISLTSIPNTYTNLYLIISQVYGSSDGADFRIQFNTDTGANYGIQNGTTLQDGLTQIGLSSMMTTSTSTYKKLQGIIEIPRYASSDYKFVPIRLSASSAATDLYQVKQGLYASTNAISSIQLKPSAGTFSGGTVYLYGVK